MIGYVRRITSFLPRRWQHALKRNYYGLRIRCGLFGSGEAEYGQLDHFVAPGDWVLDIGANIGLYTAKLSKLVGPEGRVIALEPIPETFELLTANAQLFYFQNVTLLNLAASDLSKLVSMEIPKWETGDNNYYEARIVEDRRGRKILSLPVDSLQIPERVSLVKIDTEGHDLAVLKGMAYLLKRDHPTLIVEASTTEIIDYVCGFGYTLERVSESTNYLFKFDGAQPKLSDEADKRSNASRADTGG